MKRSYFYVGLWLILISTSCSTKEGTDTKSAEMELPEITSIAEKTTLNLPDPDPTDDIPTEDNVASFASLETSELVKLTLQKEFKDDIDEGFIAESDRKFIQYEYDLNGDGIN